MVTLSLYIYPYSYKTLGTFFSFLNLQVQNGPFKVNHTIIILLLHITLMQKNILINIDTGNHLVCLCHVMKQVCSV